MLVVARNFVCVEFKTKTKWLSISKSSCSVCVLFNFIHSLKKYFLSNIKTNCL